MTREDGDPLLERIDRDLEACDASALPPLVMDDPSGDVTPCLVWPGCGCISPVDTPDGLCSVDPRVGDGSPKACGGVVSEAPVLVDEPGPPPFVMPVDRGSSAVTYVGFDVESRPEQMRGWLARWFEKWSR